MDIILITFILCALILMLWTAYTVYKIQQQPKSIDSLLNEMKQSLELSQIKSLQATNQTLKMDMQQFLETIFKIHDGHIKDKLDTVNQTISEQLLQINQRVEQKIHDNHQQSQTIYQSIIKRLTIIDQAQSNINQLSDKIVELGDVLGNKQARGLMGEVQLEQIIQNILPQRNYQMQFTLSSNHRVDCMLFLPPPTQNLAIDAKFPLEHFNKMKLFDRQSHDYKKTQQAFKQSIKKHIKDIAEKYIQPPETSEGAIMFIPSETIFACIHNDFPDLVELAQNTRVWITSPTTIVAILTTALAVIKDIETRQQVHVIKSHLGLLAKDFEAFEKHMDQLSKHIEKAHSGIGKISKTSTKITDKFHKIEQVELQELEQQ